MSTSEELKRAVGYRAADEVREGMVLGLGTGSTVRHLLDAIGERRARGELRDIVGVPTSRATEERARVLGIPLGTLEQHPRIDLALDGADEVDPSLNLIKGLGGALLREKVVVSAAGRFTVLADDSKLVVRLGEKAPLPVEVDPFSLGVQIPFLRGLGCTPALRLAPDGAPFRTDGGNLILDCRFEGGIDDPAAIADTLDRRVGVLEHGLFLGMASGALIATASGVRELTR